MQRISSLFVAGAIALALALPASASDRPPFPKPSALEGSSLTWCGDVPEVEADPALFRDRPVYVGDPPTGKLDRWARKQPGYADLWIDRGNLGWIVVAFAEDADERMVDIRRRFPGLGAVAVPVERSLQELKQANRRTGRNALPLLRSGSLGVDATRNIVELDVHGLTVELVAALEPIIGDDPVCVGGSEPSGLDPDAPQPLAGDGWTLLGHHQADRGPFYRTGLASDRSQYEGLWNEASMPGEPPAADLVDDVVVWFAAPHGSSCDLLRLDDVVVDQEAAVVRPSIVVPDDPGMCTDDLAGSYQYLVAIERDRLPAPPFTTQLYPEFATRDRVVIEADLRSPGSVATNDQIYAQKPPKGLGGLRSGDVMEVGYRSPFVMDVSCGVGYLGELNGIHWVSDRTALPKTWRSKVTEDDELVVSVLLKGGRKPTATARTAGTTIRYRPQRNAPASACAERAPAS